MYRAPGIDIDATAGTKFSVQVRNEVIALVSAAGFFQAIPPLGIVSTAASVYVIGLTDVSKLITSTSSSAQAISIPLNSTIAFPIGVQIDVTQFGTGQLSFSATAGVTLRRAVGVKISAQYGRARLIKTATDTWLASGDLMA